jgi:Outer membrane protein beta-barrel domain
MTLGSRSVRSIAMSLVLACAFLAATAAPAHADITAFLGVSPTPQNHAVKGIGVGVGLLIVGFEFEYANLTEDTFEQLTGLKTYSGNVLVQTPTPGVQLYGTIGAEGYQETLGNFDEKHYGTNIGGGAKISLIGPFRVRVDYRIFKLQGQPVHDVYQRFYVGANLKF